MSRIIKPNFEFKDERGILRELTRGSWEQLNEYERKKGSIAGNHFHKLLKEFFYVVKGSVLVKLKNVDSGRVEEFTAKAGDAFVVYPFESHSLKFNEDTTFITLLSRTFDSSNPDVYEHKLM